MEELSMLAIDDLIIGNTYSAKEYSGAFKCSHMGVMNYSSKTKSLVLISKQNNGIYNDKWDYNTKILHYTGGQVGDQVLTAANKRLLNAKSDGTKVYLFEVFKNGEYFYQGEVELVDLPYQVEELDINGNNRKVWKFPIRKIDGRLPAAVREGFIKAVFKCLPKIIYNISMKSFVAQLVEVVNKTEKELKKIK